MEMLRLSKIVIPLPGKWDAKKYSKSFIGDYKPYSTVDGEGIRCSIYVSGCLFKCKGCYNESLWSFRAGQEYNKNLETEIFENLSKPYVQGLSILGGEPFLNTPLLLKIVKKFKKELPNKDIWCWSGYTIEQLLNDTEDKKELLSYVDVLIEGQFVEELKDLTLPFRGSSNQRILKVSETISTGKPVHYPLS